MTSDSVVAAPRRLEAHALQDVAVGHAGRGEEAVVARDEVVRRQLALEVVAPRRAPPVRSSSSRGHSRPTSSPPMHLIAAAEMTPSGVPPMPHSRSTGERSLTASSAARDVAVGDQPHARAGLADRR